MSGANQNEAAAQVRAAIQKAVPGSHTSLKGHLKRAELIAREIWKKDQALPVQWRLKHVRWFLAEYTKGLVPSSRYDYWRTVKAILAVQGKLDAWSAQLNGPWKSQNGTKSRVSNNGRPSKLPHSYHQQAGQKK